jgi:hypothetical protein
VVPLDKWLQSDLADAARDIFNSKNSACARYFEMGQVNGIMDIHRNKKGNLHRQIFALLSFELWHKNFFERKEMLQ